MFTPRTSAGVATDDPLTIALNGLVAPNETPAERAQRIALEQEARKISDEIDERLRLEHIESRNKEIVKILLLGSSHLLIADGSSRWSPLTNLCRAKRVWEIHDIEEYTALLCAAEPPTRDLCLANYHTPQSTQIHEACDRYAFSGKHGKRP